MNLVYNSPQFYVLEYPAQHGYELVDKHSGRGAFIQGEFALKFRSSIQDAAAEDPSIEHIDEFLENFQPLMTLPVVLH
ncbi:MAG: DUF3567 family protein [Proteobacteria bacterium]|nr:DUF3567 family protein [Burkholderiales bacterium]